MKQSHTRLNYEMEIVRLSAADLAIHHESWTLTLLAQGTAFTYQGRLNDNGAPAKGFYDLQFAIFDAATAGGQIGTTLTSSAVAVSNGVFTVTLDFGAGIFTGANRWLDLTVKTNGGASFTPLTPRQSITAAPYAIMAGSLSGTLPGVNLGGVYGNAVTLTNTSNQFDGSGAGLVAIQSTNVINSRYVINVQDYGAVPTANGSIDSTLAISNAINAQAVLRRPLYFPCPSNCYYKVSGTFIYDGLGWTSASPFNNLDTEGRVEIIGDYGSEILQTVDQPVFAFTNGINSVKVTNLKLTRPASCASSTAGGFAFYCDKASRENTDNATLDHVYVENFKYGLYSESTCVLNVTACGFPWNQYCFFLINTNSAGYNATGNNSILFQSCDLTSSWTGGYILGGNGVVIDSCEGGASTQTNFLTIDSASGLSVLLRGGNVELHHGAGVRVVGYNPPSVNITEMDWGLNDFSGSEGAWNIFSTNAANGPRVILTSTAHGAGAVPSWDCGYNHFYEVLQGSTLVKGSNQWSGAFANRLSLGNEIMADDGINYGGPAGALNEGMWITRYRFDVKGRTALSFGAVSNWGPGQSFFWRNLLQYNYDKEDGLLVNTGGANNYTGSNYFGGNLVFDGRLGNTIVFVCDGIKGPLFRSSDPTLSIWSQIGTYNYTADEFGIYRGSARNTAPTIPFFWVDLANNRTSIGHATASQPRGTATLNVEGTAIISGLATATNGFASWRSNGLPAMTISTKGYTNNILTPACNVNVYLQGTSLTVIKNTKILVESLTGALTVCLKPNEYLTSTGTISSMQVEPQ